MGRRRRRDRGGRGGHDRARYSWRAGLGGSGRRWRQSTLVQSDPLTRVDGVGCGNAVGGRQAAKVQPVAERDGIEGVTALYGVAVTCGSGPGMAILDRRPRITAAATDEADKQQAVGNVSEHPSPE